MHVYLLYRSEFRAVKSGIHIFTGSNQKACRWIYQMIFHLQFILLIVVSILINGVHCITLSRLPLRTAVACTKSCQRVSFMLLRIGRGLQLNAEKSCVLHERNIGFFLLKDMQTPPSEMTPSKSDCKWCAMF